MKTKLCRKCNIKKDIENFRLKKDKNGKYYTYSYCKECEKLFFELNKENKKIVDKKYREVHKEEIKQKRKNRQLVITQDEKEKQREYYKIYVKNNKEKLKTARNKYEKKKKEEDKVYRLKCQARHCIYMSFSKKGLLKSKNTECILGITMEKFYKHLLQTFKNNYGYEWDGIEKVHIDHILPLSIAKTEEEVIKLCYYTNLQLLKEKDNLEKRCKLNWELQS